MAAPPAPSGGDILTYDSTDARVEWASPANASVLFADSTTLTNDTVAATSTWEDWATETATVTDPGREIDIISHLNGTAVNLAAVRIQGLIRIGISTDGGSTYNFGTQGRGDTDRATADIRVTNISVHHTQHDVTPTGNVVVKAQIQQVLGVAADMSFQDGFLSVMVIPS